MAANNSNHKQPFLICASIPQYCACCMQMSVETNPEVCNVVTKQMVLGHHSHSDHCKGVPNYDQGYSLLIWERFSFWAAPKPKIDTLFFYFRLCIPKVTQLNAVVFCLWTVKLNDQRSWNSKPDHYRIEQVACPVSSNAAVWMVFRLQLTDFMQKSVCCWYSTCE